MVIFYFFGNKWSFSNNDEHNKFLSFFSTCETNCKFKKKEILKQIDF